MFKEEQENCVASKYFLKVFINFNGENSSIMVEKSGKHYLSP